MTISTPPLAPPTSIAARYQAAITFPAFLTTVQKNRNLWLGVTARVQLDPTAIAELKIITAPWHFAVLSEDWCGDAVNIVPVVQAIADALPNADLRLFPRDQNLDLMDAHLTRGGRAIPVVILYDDQFVERAWWGPRPSELQHINIGMNCACWKTRTSAIVSCAPGMRAIVGGPWCVRLHSC